MSGKSDFLKRVDEAPPAWSDNIIAERNINKYQKYSQFVRRAYWTDSGSINVFCIRGTDHTDYQGLTYLHGVSLRHYEFDDALLSVYAELQAERLCQQQAGLYWEIDLHSETLGREDTPGWKIDHFSPGFTLRLVGGLQGGDLVPDSLRRVTVRQADEGRVLLQQIQSLRQMQIKPVTGAGWLNRWFRGRAK
ncbi:hypothetical protein ACQJKX_001256 [Salmonella enterica]|nr:hypothetical protein [Salmonella enterica subsp. enterica serovar Newport]EBQ3710369.1 hypothetical protein [Salmonella enterica]ECC7192565.1 hypothetical protein [Salmonella enterica]EEA3058245.1 hypothetical protein [Salmonella enterica subsp. enterica serovar Newport]EEA6338127.1 hypothetical protein [Salmonella enterica subsp. enterica serovar Newport]